MSLYKILLGVLTVIITSVIGVFESSKYKKKATLYADLLSFTKKMQTEIKTNNSNLITIVKSSSGGDFFNIMLDKILEANGEAISFGEKNFYRVKKSELAEIESFFNGLGRTDKDNQLKMLSDYETLFREKKEAEDALVNKNCPMFIKLGFLAGAAIFIILV